MFRTSPAVDDPRRCVFFSSFLSSFVAGFSSLGDIDRPATAESTRESSSVMVVRREEGLQFRGQLNNYMCSWHLHTPRSKSMRKDKDGKKKKSQIPVTR